MNSLSLLAVTALSVVHALPEYYNDQLLVASACPPVAPPCVCETPTEKVQ